MREASAFSPGHLTGFFQICDEPEDPLRKGSRGAGFSITHGVHTRVKTQPADRGDLNISINGEPALDAMVSENVAKRMVSKLDRAYHIIVDHEVQVPIGAGFGSSGAGALSLALALNEALDLDLSRVEAARVAHLAEIDCKTGLGTVIAEFSGGFGVLVEAGAPGIGKTIKFKHGDDLFAVSLCLGPISTEEALSNPQLRTRINEWGGTFVNMLRNDQSLDLFMCLSRRFAENVGLITPRLMRVFDEIDEAEIPCSMAMFGETFFSLVEGEETVDKLVAILMGAAHEREILVSGINEQGARVT